MPKRPPPPPRLPACDPCRRSKLACDHAQPVCERCRCRNQSASCTYRLAPFQRARTASSTITGTAAARRTTSETTTSRDRDALGDLPLSSEPRSQAPTESPSPIGVEIGVGVGVGVGPMPKPHLYPNPGYLGLSSYTTYLGHLPSESEPDSTSRHPEYTTPGRGGGGGSRAHATTINEAHISHGSELITQLCRFAHSRTYVALVRAWLATGANLALAGFVTEQCTRSADRILTDAGATTRAATDISKSLFMHSCKPMVLGPETTSADFCSQFTHQNSRWETLCFFFIAVSRATIGSRSPESPFQSEQQRRSTCRLSMYYADRCLDIATSLDCLNDLQLILQYENFILHTLVDGDHSFESWRRLGDVASSLFALGYHHDIEGTTTDRIPGFLKEIRCSAFYCSYSADKNVSIFLGRPPRISQKFCELQSFGLDQNNINEWVAEAQLDFTSEARWAAICALLKEDILDFSRENMGEERTRKASLILSRADLQWSFLPESFRLEGPLKDLDQHPIQVDRILGVKLNHLHVLFLLHVGLISSNIELDSRLNTIATEMLSLVIEALMLKDRLISSGTSLVWKVAYYGLAAAGVICLSLLRQPPVTRCHGTNTTSKVLRDLSVLVTEIELGTLAYPEDANYALLHGAAQTIKNLVDRILSSKLDQFHHSSGPPPPEQQQQSPSQLTTTATFDDESLWNHHWGLNNFQDSESNFWMTLAEHPFLTDSEFQI